eukprot:627563-Prymnesium_polylepis.1
MRDWAVSRPSSTVEDLSEVSLGVRPGSEAQVRAAERALHESVLTGYEDAARECAAGMRD